MTNKHTHSRATASGRADTRALNCNLQRLVALLLIGILTGACAGTVRSTGASLPVDAETFDDGALKVGLSYNCSGVRCDSVDVRFENLADRPLVLKPADSRLSRAGQTVLLVRRGEQKGPLTLQPKEVVKETWAPVAVGGKTSMSFTRPKEVWCSLKAPKECGPKLAKTEAACAGFARYYYETYNSTGGWLSFQFAYESSLRKDVIASPKPQAASIAPAVVLEENDRAPSFLSNPSDIVFYKIACNEKCDCKETAPRRNFFLDDKIQAEFK